MKNILEKNIRTFVLAFVFSFLVVCGCLIFSCPQIAIAEEKSGIQVILPNMIEFIPMLIAFIIVAIVLAKFGWPAFEKMIQARDDKIKQNIQDSEDAKFEASKQLNAYKQKLADADFEASKIIAQAKDDGTNARETLEKQGQQKADERLKSAQNTIAIDKRRAEHEIQSEVVDIAMMVTEKVIGQDLTTEQHRKLIEKYVEQAGSIAKE